MEQFNELKNTVHGAWLDAIWGEDADMIDCHMDSLRDQVSGYADMSMEDADALGMVVADVDMDAWHNFINQCAKEFLDMWAEYVK